ncbi:Prohibitin-2, subunit of the prohibitin complex (Phb1p-Phb2p) [Asimina triloba]
MDFNRVRGMPGGGAASSLAKVAVIGGLGLYAAVNSLYNVEGGHRAIVFNRILGIKEEVYPEGTHFMIPWFERPIIYDVRARPHLVESTSGSRDLQMVNSYPDLFHRIDVHPSAHASEPHFLPTCERHQQQGKEEQRGNRGEKKKEEDGSVVAHPLYGPEIR